VDGLQQKEITMFTRRLLERMVRAFIAAAMATLAAGVVNADTSVPALKALVVGAIASGISAAISMVSTLFGDAESASFVE
jgi:hypothetical protein